MFTFGWCWIKRNILQIFRFFKNLVSANAHQKFIQGSVIFATAGWHRNRFWFRLKSTWRNCQCRKNMSSMRVNKKNMLQVIMFCVTWTQSCTTTIIKLFYVITEITYTGIWKRTTSYCIQFACVMCFFLCLLFARRFIIIDNTESVCGCRVKVSFWTKKKLFH